MIEKLFEVGLTLEQGIFFFLFIFSLGISYALVWWIMRRGEQREKNQSTENNARELRYIGTIDKLAISLSRVDKVDQNVSEMRKDLHESNERQEKMIGRLLDKIPN